MAKFKVKAHRSRIEHFKFFAEGDSPDEVKDQAPDVDPDDSGLDPEDTDVDPELTIDAVEALSEFPPGIDSDEVFDFREPTGPDEEDEESPE
jgi:hypothetical protein